MPDLDSLKAIVQAFIDDAVYYIDTDYSSSSGHYCHHCNNYFEPNYPQGKEVAHSPDCLVLQAQAVLNDTTS